MGQIIRHLRYEYRGVVFGFDLSFRGTDEWYYRNRTQPEKDQPWYHVMVDGGSHTTYVAEENLRPDTSAEPVEHPLLEKFFPTFHDGRYYNHSLN